MKKLLLLFLSAIVHFYVYCQPSTYWQQKVDYKIDVTLTDTSKTLDGYISMQYYNNSPDTLHFIWIHLWPNAYKNDRTAFSDQMLEHDRKDFYFSSEEKRGYINRLDFKVDKTTALLEDHPQHQDIVKLLLPRPLPPGSSVKIETPFHVKLPYDFSRGGYIGNSFQVTQWYPKPAVYDRKGWHEMPYLDQGEFYSEFGEFDVQVTLPKEYVIAATGILKNETDNGASKTMHYVQNNVHDFAWFADKNFEVKHDTLQLATHTVDLYAYYFKENSNSWLSSMASIKAAIKTKTNWLGEYPYDIMSVVEKPGKDKSDGMEYPTIVWVGSPAIELIYHEIGHNWFYGILATNERQHPWMDEGMNTYYDNRYEEERKSTYVIKTKAKPNFMGRRIPDDGLDILLRTLTAIKKDQPIETSSENFSYANYDVIAYYKTSQWMKLLEASLGKPTFDSVMHAYYAEWKFKHPYPEDFKLIAEKISGRNLDSTFRLLNTTGYLEVNSDHVNYKTTKKLKLASFFSMKETDRYNYIFAMPAIGYNNYDQFMVGALLHNYTMPATRLRFIVAPLYATGSKQFNGIGNINFSTFINKRIDKVVLGVTAARFSTNQSVDTLDKKIFENFSKIVPSLQVYFRHPIRSHIKSWLDFRTYLINEKGFTNFTVKANSDSMSYYPLSTATASRYINEVSFNLENTRVLYPYNYQLKFQQGKGFYRFDVNGEYFFNYSKGGGMSVRLFASKFGYLSNDHSNGYQYFPKLLAANGEGDYTYSNYFVGRSATLGNSLAAVQHHGIGAHQVMIRDGGFKLRLDQFGYLQGASEKWVAALNFNTTLPDIFPAKIPLKIFLDIGSYSEAWKEDSENSKFLYAGGLQLSLLKGLFNIYAPLVYSKEFRNVYKSQPELNGFVKRLTFSIDIQKFSFKRIFPQIRL